MSILIVEDNAVNAKLLTVMLKASGYETVLAHNGTEAMEKLSANADIELIITDFMMPEMDGLEFTAKVKAMPLCKDLPIILASAHSDLETVRKARSLGCDGFLVKPIDRQQLIERVEHLLNGAPVVLRDKKHVMSKLDIWPAEYHHLADAFAAQLSAIMPVLVLEEGDSEESLSGDLVRLLRELAESAALLGAEKFLRLYERCKEGNLLTRSQCPGLLRALQKLELALKSCRGQA